MNLHLRLVALCASLCAIPVSQADELGRLFFTPQQRLQLQLNQQQPDENSTSPSALTLNGIVQKDGGKRTVWLNGIAQTAEKSEARSPDSHLVNVPGQDKPVRVKVGQKAVVAPLTTAEKK